MAERQWEGIERHMARIRRLPTILSKPDHEAVSDMPDPIIAMGRKSAGRQLNLQELKAFLDLP